LNHRLASPAAAARTAAPRRPPARTTMLAAADGRRAHIVPRSTPCILASNGRCWTASRGVHSRRARPLRDDRRHPCGTPPGLIVVTTPLYFNMSHQILPDGMLNAWLVWALYWLLRGQHAGWSLGPVLAFYACFTGALLSKGPQALAALAAAGVAVAFTDGTAMLRRLRPVLGSVLAFGVATIVWLLPYQARSQGSFDDQVLTGHYLTWYLLGPILPRFTALWAPLPSFLPWTLLVAAAPFWWRQSPDAGRRRIALWTATLWLLVAISGNYRSRYILVVFPGLALLTAEFLTARVTGPPRRAWRTRPANSWPSTAWSWLATPGRAVRRGGGRSATRASGSARAVNSGAVPSRSATRRPCGWGSGPPPTTPSS